MTHGHAALLLQYWTFDVCMDLWYMYTILYACMYEYHIAPNFSQSKICQYRQCVLCLCHVFCVCLFTP